MKATLVQGNSGRFYLEIDGKFLESAHLSQSKCQEMFGSTTENRIPVEVTSEYDFNGFAWEECMKLDSDGCIILNKI